MFWKWNSKEFGSIEEALDKVEEFSRQRRSTKITLNEDGTASVAIQAATDTPPASNIDGNGGTTTYDDGWTGTTE